MSKTIKKNPRIPWYGWTPDLPDQRDFTYVAPPTVSTTLGESVDLRPQLTPVYDQGDLGSCTANAIGAAWQFELKRQTGRSFRPSRLFIYFNEREIEGTIDSDSGAMIRDGIRSVAKQGVCTEPSWPYVIDKFAKRPPARCYETALTHQALKYMRVSSKLEDMLGCLNAGNPFVFGFSVYESFESTIVARTGIVPMPKHNENLLGGHAVMAVGYDLNSKVFIVRNSWGARWGIKGYFLMPLDYLTSEDLADDRWTISMVEDKNHPDLP